MAAPRFPATIPNAQFWLQGSVQPWVLADPVTAGRIYVIASDDPDNNNAMGDGADVFISTSANSGVTWGGPTRIDSDTGSSFQVMPTAAIDQQSGCIVVHYYDSRNGNTNPAGNLLLDVFATASTDGGVTFSADAQFNATAFDPDPGAACRFNCTPMLDADGDGMVDEDSVDGVDNDGDGLIDEDPVDIPTTRIGEYNGVAVGQCATNFVWAGNTVDAMGNPTGQQTIHDSDLGLCDGEAPEITCPADQVVECDESTDPAATGSATASDNCDLAPLIDFSDAEVAGLCAEELTITRTWTATDAAGNSNSCDQVIGVVDTTPPVVVAGADNLECLWPPSHKYVFIDGVTAAVQITDNCDPNPMAVQTVCMSDQCDDAPCPDNPGENGDGKTVDDCVYDPMADQLAARAERAGTDPAGRTYTLDLAAADSCTNLSDPVDVFFVHVPHDQNPPQECTRASPDLGP
jgi:hypothetical protein